MFDTMVKAASNRWTHSDELLVQACTLLDVLVRVTVAANTNRPPRFGPPFTYPRPGQSAVVERRAVRPRDFFRRLMGGGG